MVIPILEDLHYQVISEVKRWASKTQPLAEEVDSVGLLRRPHGWCQDLMFRKPARRTQLQVREAVRFPTMLMSVRQRPDTVQDEVANSITCKKI